MLGQQIEFKKRIADCWNEEITTSDAPNPGCIRHI